MENINGTSTSPHFCPKCGKPFCYVEDIPEDGFVVGLEPYCTCGTKICKHCGQRYVPKCNHENAN